MLNSYQITGLNKYSGYKGLIYSPDPKNALKGFLLQQKIKYSKIQVFSTKVRKDLKLMGLTEEEIESQIDFTIRNEYDNTKKAITNFKVI